MMDLEAWAAPLIGQSIDLDGVFPGECHDVGLAYMYALGVTPGDGHAPGSGYTDQVWRAFPHHRPGLANFFTRHGPEQVQRGDLVYWSAYAGNGLPHVAVALEAASGGTVLCVTQNPGPVTIARLSTVGVLGVLRPITLEDDMFSPEDHQRLKNMESAAIIRDKRLTNMEKAAIARDKRLKNMEGALISTLSGVTKMTAALAQAGGSPEAAAIAKATADELAERLRE